jgi:hypothetical protein
LSGIYVGNDSLANIINSQINEKPDVFVDDERSNINIKHIS